ncbi:LPP20 family lipoprotein [Fibrobacter succinogenes]|uniref:LPP20 family lipoprotein n=1 Tax=Fibrobacter succinogenes TaxID=833 RepID=UPI00156A2317|nr:LPP20 family lipoprotein [Fibrobacter succinogenes]
MKKLIACLALAAMFAGCSSNPPQTPQEKQASLLIEMQMQKKSYLKQHIPAGIGIGESADEQIAYEKADQNARVDLAKSIDAQTKALVKNFKEDVSDEIAEHFQSTSKTAVSQRLNGATLSDVKVETTADGKFKVYGVMTLDSDLVSEYIKMLEQQEKKAEVEKIRAAAEKAYAELDEMDD